MPGVGKSVGNAHPHAATGNEWEQISQRQIQSCPPEAGAIIIFKEVIREVCEDLFQPVCQCEEMDHSWGFYGAGLCASQLWLFIHQTHTCAATHLPLWRMHSVILITFAWHP